MMELILAAGAIGCILFLAVSVLGLILLRKIARSDAKAEVKSKILMVLSITVVGAMVWAPNSRRLQRGSASETLEGYCTDAAEQIFKTVDDVEGILIRSALPDAGPQHYHEEDDRVESFLSPPEKNYWFVELGSSVPGAKIRHAVYGWNGAIETRLDLPTARYALTWRAITDIPAMNAGIYGDETVIYDLVSKEILARRVMYYYVERRGRHMDDAYHMCPQVNIGIDETYRDLRPRDSYDFVSRVLKPPVKRVNDTPARVTPELRAQVPAHEPTDAEAPTPSSSSTTPLYDSQRLYGERQPMSSPKSSTIIKRWIDQNGQVHYSDREPDPATR